jgi:UDP-N-acetylmuramoylalanine--D-glutamate ligase
MDISYKEYFEGKRITKQGFGFLGRGANVVKFLLENGAKVLVTDMKTEKELEKSILELESFLKEKNINKNNITYRLGEHRLEDFGNENCDFVIQASGVAKDNAYLNHAKESGIKVYQEGSLFASIIRDFNEQLDKKDRIKIIGITGTRGKTTTTFLIKKIIEDWLINSKSENKVYFGGNVQGVATLELLSKIKERDFVVMELDSWVLQGFSDIGYSPDIAVFTNFMPDHMNYYKNNMDEYFLDKAAIFLNQKVENVLITHENIKSRVESVVSKGEKVFINDKEIEEDKNKYESKLLGEHNRYYISLAKHVARKLNIFEESFRDSVKSFGGVAGRLDLVRELGGVKYINDTTATTGEASSVALETFRDENIILISGGRDKDLDITNYANKVIEYKNKNIIKKVILLNSETTTGTHKIINIFTENNFTDFILVDSIEKAVVMAKENGIDGDTVLFTPAFASFGMFQNEYDRGEKFVKIVNSLE